MYNTFVFMRILPKGGDEYGAEAEYQPKTGTFRADGTFGKDTSDEYAGAE